MSLPPRELPPLYYLDNFMRVLQAVHHQYYDVLTPQERQLINQFRALNPRARGLMVRMVMRRGIDFRPVQLQYPELGEVTHTLATLVEQGWLLANPMLSPAEFCQHCRLTELQHWARQTPMLAQRAPSRKVDWPRWLQAHYSTAQSWQQWWQGQPPSALFRLQHSTFYDILKLLFFGSFRPGWDTFVIADLGYQRFPAVALTELTRAFQSRIEIDFSCQLQSCTQAGLEGLDPITILEQLPSRPPNLSHWLWQRRERLYLKLAEQLERIKQPLQALEHYAQCTAPGARLRWLRLLAKQGHYATLANPLARALAKPEDDAEAMAIGTLLRRVRKHLPHSVTHPLAQTHVQPVRQLCILAPSSKRVERAVCAHLHASGKPILWSENTLWNALFGLLFWPVLFAPIPGAFFHPYQAAPADLYRPDFVPKRKLLFDQQLAQLEHHDDGEFLLRRYDQYAGLNNAFIAWTAFSREQLNWALMCIPKAHINLICQRMLQNLKLNRSGFPDLIQFNLAARNYQLYEVKGPGDRLQDHQLRWLWFFQQHNIPAEVIDVEWLSDSST